jgi:chemotaxis signal transduction protein
MSTLARDIHDAFDAGFAAALPPPAPAHSDFLCIRIGGDASALPLADVTSLHADLRIVALPSRAPELVGVAAIRSAVVPIYDLRVAFGRAATTVPRWTVLVRGGTAGFCFESFDGHLRIPDRAIAASSQRGHGRGQFTAGGQPRSIIDLGATLTAIETRWRTGPSTKDS